MFHCNEGVPYISWFLLLHIWSINLLSICYLFTDMSAFQFVLVSSDIIWLYEVKIYLFVLGYQDSSGLPLFDSLTLLTVNRSKKQVTIVKINKQAVIWVQIINMQEWTFNLNTSVSSFQINSSCYCFLGVSAGYLFHLHIIFSI